MGDYLVRATTKDGFVRAFACDTTASVNRAKNIHNTSATVSAAMGRTLTATAMMGAMQKSDEGSVTLQIKGDGKLGRIICVSDFHSHLKCYVENPFIDYPPKPNGKLDVSRAVGKNGSISVVTDLRLKEPYVGQTKLVTSEIAEDLAYYYAVSEQIPSVVALGVLVDTDLSIKSAGGFIIQLMPGADDEIIGKIENSVNNMSPISELLSKGNTPEDILKLALTGFELSFNGTSKIEYKCDCSEDRVTRALISMGKGELKAMIDEQGSAEITCQFCDKIYNFDKNDLKELLDKAMLK